MVQLKTKCIYWIGLLTIMLSITEVHSITVGIGIVMVCLVALLALVSLVTRRKYVVYGGGDHDVMCVSSSFTYTSLRSRFTAHNYVLFQCASSND